MRASACLIVLLALTVLVMWLRHAPADHPQHVMTLLIGLLILGAWLAGLLAERLRLPRLSGYLLFGILIGPSAWSLAAAQAPPDPPSAGALAALPLLSADRAADLHFVKGLAIALIAITAGGEIRLSWLRQQLRAVVTVTLVALLGVAAVIWAGVMLLQNILPVAVDHPTAGGELAVIAALLALIAAGNSPSVAIAMVSELRAEGPLSRFTLAVTVCKDLLLIVLFATLLAVAKGALDPRHTVSAGFALAVGVQLGGSLLIGAAMGLGMAWFVAHTREHLVFFIVGACFLFALLGEQTFHIAGHQTHLKPLLIGLAAGLTMRNATPRISEPLFQTVEQMSIPVYCLFFAVAGAQLQLEIFTTAQTAAAIGAIVLLRAAAIRGLLALARRRLQLDPAWSSTLWLGLLPQAGITLALATVLADAFTDAAWVGPLHQRLLGLVAIHLLIGPIAFRYALVRSGEVGRADAAPPTAD